MWKKNCNHSVVANHILTQTRRFWDSCTCSVQKSSHIRMHMCYIEETAHTSVCLVEGTWFTSVVLHPVSRSGMRWPGTAVVWICAVGGRHWTTTSWWPASTISLLKRSPWASIAVSHVWTTLQNRLDNSHLTENSSFLSPKITSVHLLEMRL